MGVDAAQVVSHGALNYLTGADVASKLGHENLIPYTGLFSQLMDSRRPLKDRLDAGALNLMGPVINGGASIAQGIGKLADGDIMGGLGQMSPAATKGIIKAVDMTNNGFTDARGNKLPMEATTWDTAVQAAGFTPTKKATQQEAQRAVTSMQSALKMRESELTKRFVAAVDAKDVEARLQVMDEAREFMRANPGIRVDFAGALRRKAREAALAASTGSGVRATPRQLATIREQTRFAEQP
jgi:hypothetical protein